ncbi:MAG: LytTR family DNA-binding domain-containing protein [Bacteroidota bacterium]|nr:LytTR family DNA-binding domain-containing protein [Bacteroidota bacterium]
MKVIIIEDEQLSAEHLTTLLKKVDNSILVIGTADSVKKSIKLLSDNPQVDLLFVDIHLADGVSFDIFSKVTIDTPIIFTTAYNEYAIKAFKVNSIDYLLKPIGIEDLRGAVQKFEKLKNTSQQKINSEKIDTAFNIINKQYKTRFMVKMGDTISSIKTEDIAHFIAEDGIVLLVIKTGKRYPIDYTLDQLEQLIDLNLFFRINRKVLIQIDAVKKVSSYFNSRYKINSDFLQEDDGIVSRERVNDFKNWLDK